MQIFNTERNFHGTAREYTTCITVNNDKTCYGADIFYCVASEDKNNHSDLSENSMDLLVSVDCITEEL